MYRIVETIGPSYNEYHVLYAANHQLIEVGGKINRTVFLPPLIQQHHVVAVLQLLYDRGGFLGPLLVRTQMLRIFYIRNANDTEWNIMFQPLLEFVNDCSQLTTIRFAYTQQGYPHPTNLGNFGLSASVMVTRTFWHRFCTRSAF